MLALVKKDIQTNQISVHIGVFMFILITYLITLPPSFIFLISFTALALSIFINDERRSVNRFLLSMPIDKSDIVKSRYLYSMSMALYTLVMQFVIMLIFHLFSLDFLYMYSWKDIIALFGLACLMLAICIPIIYALSSFIQAMMIIYLAFIVGTYFLLNELAKAMNLTNEVIFNDLDPGFALIVERYFPTPSYWLFLIFSLLILYLSTLLSIRIFKRNDY